MHKRKIASAFVAGAVLTASVPMAAQAVEIETIEGNEGYSAIYKYNNNGMTLMPGSINANIENYKCFNNGIFITDGNLKSFGGSYAGTQGNGILHETSRTREVSDIFTWIASEGKFLGSNTGIWLTEVEIEAFGGYPEEKYISQALEVEITEPMFNSEANTELKNVVGLEGKTIVKYSTDTEHRNRAFALTSDNELYGWGYAGLGEHGLGELGFGYENIPAPVLLSIGSPENKIIDFNANTRSLYVLLEDGSVWVSGYETLSGRSYAFKEVPELKNINIKSIKSSRNSDVVAVLTQENEVYLAGRANFLPNSFVKSSLTNVEEVYGEVTHDSIAPIYAKTFDGELYAVGGGNYGALGNGVIADYHSNSPSAYLGILNSNNQSDFVKVLGLDNEIVNRVVIKSGGAFVLTESSKLFAFGDGGYAANGNGKNWITNTDTDKSANNHIAQEINLGNPVANVISGDYFGDASFAVTESGDYYTWGTGNIGRSDNKWTPVKMVDDIVQFNGAGFALDSSGVLHIMKSNTIDTLKIGDHMNVAPLCSNFIEVEVEPLAATPVAVDGIAGEPFVGDPIPANNYAGRVTYSFPDDALEQIVEIKDDNTLPGVGEVDLIFTPEGNESELTISIDPETGVMTGQATDEFTGEVPVVVSDGLRSVNLMIPINIEPANNPGGEDGGGVITPGDGDNDGETPPDNEDGEPGNGEDNGGGDGSTPPNTDTEDGDGSTPPSGGDGSGSTPEDNEDSENPNDGNNDDENITPPNNEDNDGSTPPDNGDGEENNSGPPTDNGNETPNIDDQPTGNTTPNNSNNGATPTTNERPSGSSSVTTSEGNGNSSTAEVKTTDKNKPILVSTGVQSVLLGTAAAVGLLLLGSGIILLNRRKNN